MKRDMAYQVRRSIVSVMAMAVLVVGAGLFVAVEDAHAVPTFSRKYHTSCTTCHVGFPKINAFGEAFKNNGYRLPDDEVFVKEPPVWLGSESYEKVWPDAIWPSNIPGSVPISLRIIGEFDYVPTQRTAGTGKTSFEFPHEIEFLSLGTLGKNISYFLSIALQDEDERNAIEAVWLEYNDVLTGTWGIPEDFLNLRFGLFEPMAIPFSQFNQRIGLSRPKITDFKVSSADQPRMRDSQSGVEMYGVVNKRTRYATGVVNGEVKDGATENFADNNTEKDIYVRLEHKFGGLPFSGAAENSPSSAGELQPSLTYFDQGKSVTVGTTGYWGVNQVDAVSPITTKANSEYYRITGFVRATMDRYNVDVAYLHQRDDAAAGQFTGTIDDEITSNGFYVETTAFLKPWIALMTRFDNLSVEHLSVLGASNPTDNTNRLTLAMPIYARPNLRIVPEASLGLSHYRDGNVNDTYTVRADFAY